MDLQYIRIDGEKLRALRGEKPARQVATDMNVTRAAVCNWENGHCSISGDNLARLLVYYKARIEDVITSD